MPYRILADITMTAHFLFLVFLLLGGFLSWRWRRLWFAHAAVVLYALVHVTTGTDCPLTPLEHELRLRAGQDGLEPSGFIDTYIKGVVYPEDFKTEARLAATLIVAASWAGLLLLIRRDGHRRRRG